MKRLVFVLCLFASIAHAQSITWIKFDPAAIRTGSTTPATLELLLGGGSGVTGVRLDYAGGGSLALTQTSPGRWSASVPASQLLAGYDASAVSHNFVGFVRLVGSGGQTLSSYNSFINVMDGRVPAPAIKQFDSSARATPRILNLYRPNLTSNDIQSAILAFYGYYHDDYDFVQVVFALPSWP